MSFIKDALGIFKKTDLLFLESKKESDDIYTFTFEKSPELTWKAGQHGLFNITHKKVKNGTRPFTIASIPSENVVKLSMRIKDEPSEFKKALLELKQGMKISMNGPLGSFYVQDSNPSLLIAGGIGITPFRAIIKQLAAEGIANKPLTLLYVDSSETYLYKDELNNLAKNTSLIISYLASIEQLNKEISTYTTLNKNEADYYVAGPKSLVDSISTYLKQNDISKKNIKKDSFFGY